MKKKATLGILLALLVSMVALAFRTNQAKAEPGTIYIRADGSVDPSTAPIQRTGDIYTLTDDIVADADGIVIERNNMTLNGAGYTLQGPGESPPPWPAARGIFLDGRSNVTIENFTIIRFPDGIYHERCSEVTISGNAFAYNGGCVYMRYSNSHCNVSNNDMTLNLYTGVSVEESSSHNVISKNHIYENSLNGGGGIVLGAYSDYNVVSENNITALPKGVTTYGVGAFSSNNNNITRNNINTNDYAGVLLEYNSGNIVSENNITACDESGILLYESSSNIISWNNITGNGYEGLYIGRSSNNIVYSNNISYNDYIGITVSRCNNNKFFHNNIVENPQQVYIRDSTSLWDDGYPSGGNYWSDYVGVDLYSGPNQDQPGADGIGDTPYVIDANNQDHYPQATPWPTSHDIAVTKLSKTTAGSGYNTLIYVGLRNEGGFQEHVSLTLYINGEFFATQILDLKARSSTVTTFMWNTEGWAKGNYTISAFAAPVPGETDTADNSRDDGWVFITIPGDINGDKKVNVLDAVLLCVNFGRPDLNPSCDINGDGYVDVTDALILIAHFGEHW